MLVVLKVTANTFRQDTTTVKQGINMAHTEDTKLTRAGLTEVRQKLTTKQNGACAICKRVFDLTLNARGTKLVACVDHDHQTGYVRGVLCAGCNGLEGKLRNLHRRAGLSSVDLADWAHNLAQYLRQEQTNMIHPAHGQIYPALSRKFKAKSASKSTTGATNVRDIIKRAQQNK